MSDIQSFERFFDRSEPALRRALVAGYGADLGREATAEALTRAWRDWDRIAVMSNPAGYVFRIGQNWAKSEIKRKPSPLIWCEDIQSHTHFEPQLAPALASLTVRQRQAVILVACFEMSHSEAAKFLGLSRSSIQNHVERGMAHLRHELGATETSHK